MSSLQIKLNGYVYNTASILNEISGKVSLIDLKELTNKFITDIKKLGATDTQVKKAFFITCNHFDISAD